MVLQPFLLIVTTNLCHNHSNPSMSVRQNDHYQTTFTAALRFELAAMTNVFLTVVCHHETKSSFFRLTQVKWNGNRFVQKLFLDCICEGQANIVFDQCVLASSAYVSLCTDKKRIPCFCYMNKHPQKQVIFTVRYEITIIVHKLFNKNSSLNWLPCPWITCPQKRYCTRLHTNCFVISSLSISQRNLFMLNYWQWFSLFNFFSYSLLDIKTFRGEWVRTWVSVDTDIHCWWVTRCLFFIYFFKYIYIFFCSRIAVKQSWIKHASQNI